MIDEFFKIFSGKKTYLLVAAGLVLIGLNKAQLINLDQQLIKDYTDMIMLAAIAALRAGVGNGK